MMKPIRNLFAIAVLCVVLPACQSAAPGWVVVPDASEIDLDNARKLGEAAPRTPVSFSSGEGLEEKTVTVGDTYTAASGRVCRRLFSPEGQPLFQVVCRDKTGQWVLQKSLSVETTSYSFPNGTISTDAYLTDVQSVKEIQASSTSLTDDLPVALVQSTRESTGLPGDVRVTTESGTGTGTGTEADAEAEAEVATLSTDSGETLWSFARRVTGNGENWAAIASLNDIDDASRMASPEALMVPVPMLKQSYQNPSDESSEDIAQ